MNLNIVLVLYLTFRKHEDTKGFQIETSAILELRNDISLSVWGVCFAFLIEISIVLDNKFVPISYVERVLFGKVRVARLCGLDLIRNKTPETG